MRRWLIMLAATALSAGAASAQTPLSCSAVPQSICEDPELLALESERSALIGQLTGLDPQNAALADEQIWIDGLRACGEDAACYRSAYLNHNQTLREGLAALPAAADAEVPLEAPAEAPSVEEETLALDAVQEERLRDAVQEQREPRNQGQIYVASGLPGWGFFTAIGVTLLMFWWLMRARGRVKREVRAAEAHLRGRWR